MEAAPRYLPPLRRKIRNGFLLLIILFAVMSLFTILSVFFASRTTPNVLHLNYDSVSAAIRMKDAWNAFTRPDDFSSKPGQEWVTQFETALKFEESNITEPGEADTAKNIRSLWDTNKTSPLNVKKTDIEKMHSYLSQLIEINEHGMFVLAQKASSFSKTVLGISVLLFFGILFAAIYVADGLANRLAQPIKRMAEVLRDNPSIRERLHLPRASSLEMYILIKQLNELWDRLREFRQLNIDELAANQKKLESVLSSVEDAILVLDNHGKVLHVSEGMLKILSLPEDRVIGFVWSDLSTTSENYLKLREMLSPQVTPELTYDNSIELTIDGGKRVYAARHRDILAVNESQIGLLYLLHDITEIRQRERLKSEFIGVLSHELKTPLQSLGTAGELLYKQKDKFDDDVKILVETISEDISRVRAVANDFIQVTAVDLKSLRLKLEDKPLSQLLQDWIKPFKVLARDRNVTLEFVKEGSEVIWAKIDSVKLPWAVSNLLANAIRVSPAESKVTVYVTNRTSMTQIEIRDEGPGIPEEVQKHMFESYYQAPTAKSGSTAGFLGLGLTIAKEVVEAHEGTIEYFPRKPNGSVFRISLPPSDIFS
ncbi:MAG: PAS domain-containing sensor histidine kinase [Bacteriovoracia bacterium]